MKVEQETGLQPLLVNDSWICSARVADGMRTSNRGPLLTVLRLVRDLQPKDAVQGAIAEDYLISIS